MGMDKKKKMYTSDDGNQLACNLGEVKDAIQQLKNNLTVGKDGTGDELIKKGSEKLAIYLYRLIGTI